jgi:hypothetical protein
LSFEAAARSGVWRSMLTGPRQVIRQGRRNRHCRLFNRNANGTRGGAGSGFGGKTGDWRCLRPGRECSHEPEKIMDQWSRPSRRFARVRLSSSALDLDLAMVRCARLYAAESERVKLAKDATSAWSGCADSPPERHHAPKPRQTNPKQFSRRTRRLGRHIYAGIK